MEIRKLRKFVRLAMNHIERIGTREDLLILLEIADNQTSDRCLTLKQLALSGIAPESTLKRRLARLAKRGLITKMPIEGDRRVQRYQVESRALETLRMLGQDLSGFEWS